MRDRMRLSHATQEYLTRRGGRLAAQTRANYTSAFNLLTRAIRGEDPYLVNVTTSHVEKAMRHIDNPSSYNVRLGQYRTFFSWCVRSGWLKTSPVSMLETRPVVRRGAVTRHRIPADAWGHLLTVAETRHPRDRALTAIGLYSGQRSVEYKAARVSDLERGEDGVIEYLTVTRTKVHDQMRVPVCSELADELERWLDWYKTNAGDTFGNLPPNAYLIPARKRIGTRRGPGGRIVTPGPDTPVDPYTPLQDPGKVMSAILTQAGWYQRGEGAHTLRRSVAVALYEEDLERGYSAALETVQHFLGHASAATTEGYLGVDIGRKRLDDRMKRRHMLRRNAQPDTHSGNVVPFRKEVN